MPKLAGINHLAAIRAFTKAGFVVVRQGKHVVMRKDVAILVIPRANPIKPHTMGAIVKASGLSIEAFIELLK